MTGAKFYQVSVTNLTGSASSGGFGLTGLTGNAIDVDAVVATGTNDSRYWVVVSAGGLGATLSLGSGISASASGISVNLNLAGGQDSGGTAALALNWGVNGISHFLSGASITDTTATATISGSLTNLNIDNLITGTADFGLSQTTADVAFNGAGPADLAGATLIQLGLNNITATAGSAGFGIAVTSGSLGIAAIVPASSQVDGRRWVAVYGTRLSASLSLGDSISASVGSVSIEINQATGSAAGGTPALPLDWAADLQLAGTPAFGGQVNPGSLLSAPANLTIAFTGPILAVSGTLTNLNIFNVISGSADFAISQSQVNLSTTESGTADVTGATLTEVVLNHFQASVGNSAIGVAVTGGTLAIAVIAAPAATATGAIDNRTWIAVTGSNISASLSLTANVTASVGGLAISINQATGSYAVSGGSSTPAAVLDWTTDLELPGSNQFATPADQLDPGSLLPTPISLPIAFTTTVLALSGSLTNLNIFNVINASAGFAITESTVSSAAGAGVALSGATLITVGLDNITASVGAGGFGVAITGGTLGLAYLAPAAATGDSRSWIAVIGSGLSANLSLSSNLTAAVSGLSVSVNQAQGTDASHNPAAPLNWITEFSSEVNPGANLPTTPSLAIGFATPIFALSGTLSQLNVFNLIQGSASFAVQVNTGVTVTIPVLGGTTATLTGATLFQVGLGNISASAGAGGFGLTVTGGNLGLAVVEPPTPASGTDSRYWIDVVGNGLSASLTLGGVSASVQSLTLQINQAGGVDPSNVAAIALDWGRPITSGGTTITVDPGQSLTPVVSLPITDAAPAFTISATGAQVNIFNLLVGTANFGLSRSTTNLSFTGAVPASVVGATLIEVALTNLHLSVGTSGFGLTINGGDIGVVAVRAPAPATGTDSRYWVAVDATGLSVSLALGTSFTASVSNIAVQINQAGGSYVNGATTLAAAPLDWTNDLDLTDSGTFGGPANEPNPGASHAECRPDNCLHGRPVRD